MAYNEMGYWDRMRGYWADAAAAADGDFQPEVPMKNQWFPLPFSKIPFAVTGLRGSGKSVLYDGLINRIDDQYGLPSISQKAEEHRSVIRMASGKKVRLKGIVVPGQQSYSQPIFDKDFGKDGRGPQGIVHVVCWGYNRIWRASEREVVLGEIVAERSRQGLPSDATLENLRARNKREELKHFISTCTRFREAWKERSGVWLIIAVAKCDLFWSDDAERAAARKYYTPGRNPSEDDEFGAALRDLIGYLGMDHLKQVAVVPFACYRETYKFDGGITQESAMNDNQVRALSNYFRTVVGDFCVG